jgi:hypothetical protein
MPVLDDFGRAYLTLALEINKHVDGYIDGYIGPAELKAEVDSSKKKPARALLDDLSALRDKLPSGDPAREAYLKAVLRAIECTLRIQNGEELDYLDEVNHLYDISLQKVDESLFTTAHQELDTLLPGEGTVEERLNAWRKRYELRPDQLMPMLDLVRAETRKRTMGLIDLVEGEGIELTAVHNQPWSAYNWYKGNAQSLIEFNIDLPISALGLLDLFAHEAYPGHHTEGQLKEKHLYQELGYAEQAAMLLHSPSAVIAEGIAVTALEMIFPDDSHHEWNAEVLFPAVEVQADPPEVIRRIEAAREKLRYVSGNAAILYNTNEYTQDQTIDYIQTYALATRPRAEKSFRFISHPLFRSYPFTYTQGYDLIAQLAQNEDKKALFLRLLTGQMLPSQLESQGIKF